MRGCLLGRGTGGSHAVQPLPSTPLCVGTKVLGPNTGVDVAYYGMYRTSGLTCNPTLRPIAGP